MRTILIFGKGQLGQAYKNYFGSKPEKWHVHVAEEVDIRDLKAVRQAVEQVHPDVIINTAAKTDIDWCEQNPEESFAVNVLGADNVGRAAQEAGAYLVHLSSGCVQESKSAKESHSEEETPNPLGFYSWTKVWADNLLRDRILHHGRGAVLPNPLRGLILRPRQLLSSVVSPRNALAKMLTYKEFIDTANSCTVVDDLMWVTEELIEKGATGIYNVVNPGILTPYQVALALKEIINPDMQVSRISKDELNSRMLVQRIDTVLSTEKLVREGIILPNVHERLREVVSALKYNLEKKEAANVMNKIEQDTKRKLSFGGLSE